MKLYQHMLQIKHMKKIMLFLLLLFLILLAVVADRVQNNKNQAR